MVTMSWIFGAVPYLLILVAAALTVVQVLKDWHNYKHPTLRTAAVVLVFIFAVLNLVGRYLDDRSKHTEQQKQTEATKQLEGQVSAANEAQRANTKLFLDSFTNLSQKVSDLQTQVTTVELEKKLANVQTELQATQKALAPGPRAKLTFSFFPPVTVQGRSTPLANVTLPLSSDGSVHVEFTVLNTTLIDAMDGSLTFHICQACKFANEVPHFIRLDGSPNTERWMAFDHFLAITKQPPLTAVIIPPPSAATFEIGLSYRCHTCYLAEGISSKGVVHVDRSASAK